MRKESRRGNLRLELTKVFLEVKDKAVRTEETTYADEAANTATSSPFVTKPSTIENSAVKKPIIPSRFGMLFT